MIGRIWYVLTALTVVTALAFHVAIAAEGDPQFASAAASVANMFTYFTITSNVIVGVVSALLASGRARGESWLSALCVAGLTAITITAAVFHVVLASAIPALSGAPAVANTLVHTVVPTVFIAGWAAFGPRGTVHVRTVLLSLIYPVTWLAFTLIRGVLSDYYPYPFMDATQIGYAQMALNVTLVAVLYVVLAVAFGAIDRALAHRSSAAQVP
ncbi:MAG TPA: Pr6Pr family membrane protein [Kofleriaceae bacterium]|nr:Pr6Pr family membrane protein [Kofleriaceae bacterium]